MLESYSLLVIAYLSLNPLIVLKNKYDGGKHERQRHAETSSDNLRPACHPPLARLMHEQEVPGEAE